MSTTNEATTTMALPVVRSLARVKAWKLNPRTEGHYRGIDELMRDLEMRGLQDAIHVWETPEADWILKGHRRVEAMARLGWMFCAQVVHNFTDERDALMFCLADHGHTDPLDSGEKIHAVETALMIGVSSGEVAQCLGVNEERVQLWFSLAELLPTTGRTALSDGTLSMNTAEMLIRLDDSAERAEVLQLILRNPETGKPMTPADADREIKQRLDEKRNHAEWEKLRVKLMKTLKVIDGYQYIGWDEREEYILDDSGHPGGGYQYATARESEQGTFGEVAEKLSVPRLVVPAPWRKDLHVVLVSLKMMRDARSVRTEEGGDGRDGDNESDAPGMDDGADSPQVTMTHVPIVGNAVKTDATDEWNNRVRTFMSALWSEMVKNPTEIMGKEPWMPVVNFLFANASATPESNGSTLRSWLGDAAAAREFFEQDRKARWYLRQSYALIVCAQMDAAEKPEEVLTLIAETWGIKLADNDERSGPAAQDSANTTT